jgi:hypothetical protein
VAVASEGGCKGEGIGSQVAVAVNWWRLSGGGGQFVVADKWRWWMSGGGGGGGGQVVVALVWRWRWRGHILCSITSFIGFYIFKCRPKICLSSLFIINYILLILVLFEE